MLGTTTRPLTTLRQDRIMAKADLSADTARTLISYDPLTGAFVWKVRMGERGLRINVPARGNRAARRPSVAR